MTRDCLWALLLGLLLSAQNSEAEAASDFQSRFLQPPAESRILKIIHFWPDESPAQDELIRSLSKEGFGGVVCNVSFADYLESETKWKAFVRAVEQARAAGFALWLYDEKGYPSATAGGLVLRDKPHWEARGLLIADTEVEHSSVALDLPPGTPRLVAGFPVQNARIDARQMTNLLSRVATGKLSWQPPPGRWRVLAITEDRLYEGTHASQSLADHIPYPNLLDPEPTARFIELTHQAYARHLGDNLGRYFVSTFTDEPSLMSLFLKQMPYRVLPWSTNLASCFLQRHGYRIEDKLPALVADTGPETARIRHDYWNTVGTLVSGNFFGQIQDWCKKHQVLSGGHLLMEENLVNHVPLYGNFFQCLRRLDAPSIDCLTSIPEQVPWFIARLAGSAAELEGRTVTMCETSDHSQRYRPPGDNRPIRKVTEEEIRGTCNRLIVGGIDTITSYYSFDGLAADELRRINEYIGRCCFAVKGGHQIADIAVLYPVESLWTRFTPARHYANDSPGAARIENTWRDVSESLFAAGREFTYVDGRALAESEVRNGTLVHGKLRWRVVVLPDADTLPEKAWQNLSHFVATGGVVLSIGALPANSETDFPSPAAKQIAAKLFRPDTGAPGVQSNSAGGAGIFLPAGLASLAPDVIDKVLQPDLKAQGSSSLRHTHRRIEGREVYFVINDSKESWRGNVSLSVEGPGERWDPATGSCSTVPSGQDLELDLPAYGGMVLRFSKATLPARNELTEGVLPGLTRRELPAARPTVARGEFVREELARLEPEPGPGATTASARPAMWQATGSLTKGEVDTFLFMRFEYKDPLDLRGTRALVLDSWVPDHQRAPAQLLAILHEKGGADYLAQSGRLLNAPGREQTWVALDRFQLAGWSQDSNGRLDLGDIAEVRIGWGGYLGKEGEKVAFALAAPAVAMAKADGAPGAKPLEPETSSSEVDLRPEFKRFDLPPRLQGGRPTCSVFTVAGALEFAVARQQGRTPQLSIDFLNWAANDTCGDGADGGFFSDLWKGFAKHGICSEAAMPYLPSFDRQRSPGQETLTDAKPRLEWGLQLHWIKEWNVTTGLSDPELSAIKRTLQRGWPVCGGFRWPVREQWEEDVLQMCPADAVRDGHSVLLVGYRDDSGQPGGGVFIFQNSGGGGRDGFMPYAYAMHYMNDAVWVDHQAATPPANGH